MDHSDPQMPVPVMPYVHGCERGDCQASLDQATDLFGVHLKYHHDPYELVFSTRDARDFCSSWKQAAASKSWKSCELAYGPTADDYVAWKISTNKTNLIATPKNKALYGWRAWTQRWAPAPVDMRQCRVQVYGFIEYHHALGNISSCEKRIEDKWGCKADPDCTWVLFGRQREVERERERESEKRDGQTDGHQFWQASGFQSSSLAFVCAIGPTTIRLFGGIYCLVDYRCDLRCKC